MHVAGFNTEPFIKALTDAGLIPAECRRVVIDIKAGAPVIIHYETIADKRLNGKAIVDAVFELGLKVTSSGEGQPKL